VIHEHLRNPWQRACNQLIGIAGRGATRLRWRPELYIRFIQSLEYGKILISQLDCTNIYLFKSIYNSPKGPHIQGNYTLEAIVCPNPHVMMYDANEDVANYAKKKVGGMRED